jgi:hypothetical protein
MKHYVQLKDGVIFNYHQSPDHVDDSGPDVWEVEEEASDKLGMNYDPQTKVFSEAEVIRYATLNEENVIVLINETKYASEVGNNIIITNPEVEVLWQWDGQTFVNLIEKNNLEENERYVKSLDELAKQAEELANAAPEATEEVVIPDTRYKIIEDGVERVFETQQEMEDYLQAKEEEQQAILLQLMQENQPTEE